MRSVLGIGEGGENVVEALIELERMGVSGPAAAAWIRTVEEATSGIPRPDLVWSGPEVPGLHARDTRRVYEELLGSADGCVLAPQRDGRWTVFWRGFGAWVALFRALLRPLSKRGGGPPAAHPQHLREH